MMGTQMAEPTEGRSPLASSEPSEPGGEAALPPALDEAAVESRAMADGRTITYYRWPAPPSSAPTTVDRDDRV